MCPHGILIGATGLGKSELIRALVLALAISHSSEKLDMVLVDFKGCATFLGLEHLPHVSAFITNLAGELPLADRMQDALQGELIRRQELPRRAGRSSIHDYEKARTRCPNGAELPPPTPGGHRGRVRRAAGHRGAERCCMCSADPPHTCGSAGLALTAACPVS
jgi:DNA segregation ATPase FtsK/SpoIIIE, S-DNA-T family